ncbi:hypothetical protein [Spirosoma pomorum]
MLALIPFALSFFTTGYGIFQGVQASDQAARDGQDQVNRQLEQSQITALAEDAAYRRALAAANQAATEAQQKQQQNARLNTTVLYVIAGSLMLLTVWMIVHRRHRHHRVKPV